MGGLTVGDATVAGKWLSMAAGVQETKRMVMPAVVLHGSKLWTSGQSPDEAGYRRSSLVGAGMDDSSSGALGFAGFSFFDLDD